MHGKLEGLYLANGNRGPLEMNNKEITKINVIRLNGPLVRNLPKLDCCNLS